MHYHLLLTEKCNGTCKYCYEKSLKEFENSLNKKIKFDFSSPENLEIDINILKGFLKKDPNSTLIFYGGEPLLQIEKIKKIIDKINIPMRMQTNGLLLNELPIDYLNKIQKILISIDGNKKKTDYNRGKGTYDKIINNINEIRKKGYNGELVARMTISQEFPDIYEQVIHLTELIKKGIFNSIHWQLDAGFFQNDFNQEKFENFVKNYNKSVIKLIGFWISEIKKGKVQRYYPFIAIIDSLLKNEKTKLRCGAGQEGYAITTEGKIVACPIMNCIQDFKAGDLKTDPKNLKKFEINGECLNCNYLEICGGRCLYWNQANLWPEKGNKLICKTIKHLVNELKIRESEIRKLIRKKQ